MPTQFQTLKTTDSDLEILEKKIQESLYIYNVYKCIKTSSGNTMIILQMFAI